VRPCCQKFKTEVEDLEMLEEKPWLDTSALLGCHNKLAGAAAAVTTVSYNNPRILSAKTLHPEP
jgi:hypothetical protein